MHTYVDRWNSRIHFFAVRDAENVQTRQNMEIGSGPISVLSKTAYKRKQTYNDIGVGNTNHINFHTKRINFHCSFLYSFSPLRIIEWYAKADV
jgi:hypothetical protein